ncbi:MAG: DNA-directed RNA polymerase sigma-70 factor [Saprospiraceae bacterium]|nr:MAG: DNA-directed RNA polymerase sigma-70 factor [Saprospiraceae bacterium]
MTNNTADRILNLKSSRVTEEKLIKACRKEDRKAQRLLYERYSPNMLGVCKRYMRNSEDAEDAMIEAFFKVLTNIKQYSGKGSFEGWIRRIMVNECLMALRKRHNFNLTVEINPQMAKTTLTIQEELAAQDILNLLDQLPTGYRTVFNLYVLEGYKHREIGELLGISINTSKSQLILAKKRMQTLLREIRYPGVSGS